MKTNTILFRFPSVTLQVDKFSHVVNKWKTDMLVNASYSINGEYNFANSTIEKKTNFVHSRKIGPYIISLTRFTKRFMIPSTIKKIQTNE